MLECIKFFRSSRSSLLLVSKLQAANIGSTYSTYGQKDVITEKKSSENESTSWKKGIVVQPVMTNIDDLKRCYKPLADSFYISPRYYIERPPNEYTIKPFKTMRTGGHDVETGERLFKRMGGGLPVTWYWIDFKRVGPKSGPPLVERVIDIFKSRDRSAFIALVAHANVKRYILATENMKVGDLITTSGELPKNPVNAKEGDAYPVGALQIGVLVNNIEIEPGLGGVYCRAAGSCATLLRKVDDRCILKLPSNLEISINKYCMVTVGQISHASNKDEKLTHAVDIRDLGYRPRSGLWQRKTGRFGHKIKPPKPTKFISLQTDKKSKPIPYSYPNWILEK